MNTPTAESATVCQQDVPGPKTGLPTYLHAPRGGVSAAQLQAHMPAASIRVGETAPKHFPSALVRTRPHLRTATSGAQAWLRSKYLRWQEANLKLQGAQSPAAEMSTIARHSLP